MRCYRQREVEGETGKERGETRKERKRQGKIEEERGKDRGETGRKAEGGDDRKS